MLLFYMLKNTYPAIIGISRICSQLSYVKQTNANTLNDSLFGGAISFSDDGNTLAVSAEGEDSSATGIGSDASDTSTPSAGAVYVY